MFAGPGGYVGMPEHGIVLQPSPSTVLRTLTVNLPYAVLVPLKGAFAARWWLAPLSVAMLAGLLGSCRRSSIPAARGAAAGALLAAVPVLPVLGLSIDLAGGRFFYFPAAIAAALLGRRLRLLHPRLMLGCSALLILSWSLAGQLNGRAWTQASRAATAVLDGMEAAQDRYPPGSRILVDAPDMIDGAYVFRVGLVEAARSRGLRRDLSWSRGSAIAESSQENLGADLFLIGLDRDGTFRDQTANASALLARVDQSVPTGPPSTLHRNGSRFALRTQAPTLLSLSTSAPPCRDLSILVFWKTPEAPFFTMSRSRRLRLRPPDCRSWLLPPLPAAETLELRVDIGEGDGAAALLAVGWHQLSGDDGEASSWLHSWEVLGSKPAITGSQDGLGRTSLRSSTAGSRRLRRGLLRPGPVAGGVSIHLPLLSLS